MKSSLSGILFLLVASIQVGAAEQKMTLEEKIAELGDKPYKERVCDNRGENCRYKTMYDHKYTWWRFGLSDSEKAKIHARNIAKRNEYLRTKGGFKTSAEIKSAEYKEARDEVGKKVGQLNDSVSSAEARKKELAAKRLKLKTRLQELMAKKEKSLSGAREIFNNSEAAVAGDSTISEDFNSFTKGRPSFSPTKSGEEKIKKLEGHRKDLRETQSELASLTEEAIALEKEALSNDKDLNALVKELKVAEGNLATAVGNFEAEVEKIDDEKQQQKAFVDAQTEAVKVRMAREYAKKKIEELEEDGKLSEFLMRDAKDLQKDLKINDLETELLLKGLDQKISESLIGKYIQKQNEKVLEQAQIDSCEKAKACFRGIDDSSRSIIKEVDQVLEGSSEDSESQSVSK